MAGLRLPRLRARLSADLITAPADAGDQELLATMATKSKFFRVALEGETATDGRKIERSWLIDIGANYNRATYGARVNMEHVRGYSDAPPFNAYGDVLSAKAEEVTIELNGKPEKRMALFCEIEPTDALVALTGKKQKIYTSIEVAPNFAGTGKAGLVGLAVTDSPASLGTDILQFSAKADDAAAAQLKAAFDAKKQDPANHFSASLETTIEFETETAPQQTLKEAFTSFFTDLLRPEPKTPPTQEAPSAAGDVAALSSVMEKGFAKFGELMDAKLTGLGGQLTALRADHDALKTSLDNTEKHSTSRPAATGAAAAAYEQTDC